MGLDSHKRHQHGLPPHEDRSLAREDDALTEGTSVEAEDFARGFDHLVAHWDARSVGLADSFIAPLPLAQIERRRLQRFAHLCLRYAHLEQHIEGGIPCELPAHLAVIRGARSADLSDEVEALAAAERRRLELPAGPIEDLAETLDDRGIKVIEWGEADGSRAGAFLFDAETGPALLSCAPAGSARGRLILAHEYCHLLTDVDPYENRFCPFAASLSDAPSHRPRRAAGAAHGDAHGDADADGAADDIAFAERRADAFARAFLMPREHFAKTLRLFIETARRRAPGAPAARLAEIAFYYGVEAAVVQERLRDLHLQGLTATSAPALDPHIPANGSGELDPAADSPDVEALHPRGLPARFVNLALALFIKRIAAREHLERILETDSATVARLIAWLDLPPGFRERQT